MDELQLVDNMELNDEPATFRIVVPHSGGGVQHQVQAQQQQLHQHPGMNRRFDDQVEHRRSPSNGDGTRETGNSWQQQQHQHQHGRGASRDSVTSVIMMYSPDVPSAEGGSGGGYDDEMLPYGFKSVFSGAGALNTGVRAMNAAASNIGNYYAQIETEENVKCVLSSALFGVVIVVFFVVALLINPEM